MMDCKRVFIGMLLLAAFEVQAMWKLAEQLQKAQELYQQQEPSWDELLLEKQDLRGFLAEAQRRRVNPNYSMTSSKESALTLACKQDMSGETVKMLLSYGGIVINSWETEDGIWSPLYHAVQAANWLAVDHFVACENLPLSQNDLAFATRSRLTGR